MPTSKRPVTREEREAARKALELERRREVESARLAEHNRRVAESATAQRVARPGRIVSKARPAPVPPLDLEASRRRAARPLPGKPKPYTGYPYDAGQAFGPTLACPHCGMGMLSYYGRGAYFCSERRVVGTHKGCGRYSYGPNNPGERPFDDKEREYLEDPDLLPM